MGLHQTKQTPCQRSHPKSKWAYEKMFSIVFGPLFKLGYSFSCRFLRVLSMLWIIYKVFLCIVLLDFFFYIFSPVCGLSFILLSVSFKQKFLILMKHSLSIVCFTYHIFHVVFKKLLPDSRSANFKVFKSYKVGSATKIK